MGAGILAAGVKVIDISGAFRLKDKAQFKEYYGLEHTEEAVLQKAVYGLTEIHRAEIQKAELIANPGCYPTAASLPLWVYRDLLDFTQPVIVDAKSGTSGAGGRKEKDGLGYSTVYENFRSYKTAKHQHAPEIAQEMSLVMGQTLVCVSRLTFCRCTAAFYLWHTLFQNRVWLRRISPARLKMFATKHSCVTADVDAVEVKHVQHTNFCDYAHFFDENTGVVQIVAAIDNLMKGAAGQAVQNMNLMFGFPETTGVI